MGRVRFLTRNVSTSWGPLLPFTLAEQLLLSKAERVAYTAIFFRYPATAMEAMARFCRGCDWFMSSRTPIAHVPGTATSSSLLSPGVGPRPGRFRTTRLLFSARVIPESTQPNLRVWLWPGIQSLADMHGDLPRLLSAAKISL